MREARVNTRIKTSCAHSLTCYFLFQNENEPSCVVDGRELCRCLGRRLFCVLQCQSSSPNHPNLKNGILLYLQCTHFIHTVGKPIGLQVLNEKCINEAN